MDKLARIIHMILLHSYIFLDIVGFCYEFYDDYMQNAVDDDDQDFTCEAGVNFGI